jgi:hypothetical protein
MQRKHLGEAMTGAPGALPDEAIRRLTLIVARHADPAFETEVSRRLPVRPRHWCANVRVDR